MRAALICVVAVGLIAQISAECANACSGHGVCRNSDQCDCFPNYGASDCSQRVCPYGLAWVDNPRGDLNHDGLRATSNVQYVSTFLAGDSAASSGAISVPDWESFNPNAQSNEGHFYSECSNKGLCDRSSGLCVCFDGYTGSSCQRTVCPNDCSGHGVCRTVDEVAAGKLKSSVAAGSSTFTTPFGGMNKRQTDNRAGTVYHDGVNTNTLYRLWDQDMAQTCVCDAGYSGADCSRRECPRGDDPLTHRFSDCPMQTGQTYPTSGAYCLDEIQTITIDAGSAGVGDWFHFLYRDWTGKIWRTDNLFIATRTGSITACSADAKIPVYSGTTSVGNAVKRALKAIPNGIIADVTVAAANGGTTNGYVITITYTKNRGNLYAIEAVNSRDMQVNLPVCLTSDYSRDFTTVTIGEIDGNKEASTCSNRGVCDYDSGLCKCFKGYYGGDCSFQNALAQ